jgi:nucleotide-binding universal stress UspA family protein
MPYKNIAVALAGKDDEIPMIDEAVRLAITLKAKLYVLHVNEPHAGEISMMMDSPNKITASDFEKMFHEAGHEEIAKKIKVKITNNKSISKGIAELVTDCDLLILNHNRMGKLKELLTDSIDELIVNNVKCPVLIIPK